MYCENYNIFIKVTHFVFEKGKNPKKYLENKITKEKTKPVPVTFEQILREVIGCDAKNL